MAGIQEKQDISKIVKRADLIIRGKVISTDSQWQEDDRGRHIYTSVTIQILDKIKGNIKDDVFTFDVVGGTVDDISEVVSDTPAFEIDEDAIMFLSGQPLTMKQGINSKIPIYNNRVYRKDSDIAVDSFIKGLKILEQDPNVKAFQEETSQIILEEAAIAECFIYSGEKWPGASPIVSYKINQNTSDCTGEGAAVQLAANSWNNAGANFTFNYAGSHTNTVTSWNSINEIMWGTTNGSIATAYTWSVNNVIKECDIVFNDTEYTWSSTTPGASQMDVQSVALHELGHWLTLKDMYGSADSGNVMYGLMSFGQVKRILQPCDISGIHYIYGIFVPNYMLTVNSSGVSGVSISSSTGHGGTTNYAETVTSGTTVTLTAPSTSGGKSFTGWTGSGTSSNQTISFSMNGQKTVVANYAIPSYTLTVNSSGASSVSISSSTGHEGTTNYTKTTIISGMTVNLQAPYYLGSDSSRTRFNGWTGSVPSNDQSIIFMMDDVKTVIANYVPDPVIYQISSVAELQTLCNTPGDYSKMFILTADLDCSGAALTPIGNISTPFTGVFDGNSHVISNLTITASAQDDIGLFGFVGSGAQILNLGVEDVNMTGNRYVGGLVGRLISSTVTSCYSTGSVNGTDNVGGLLGRSASSTVTSCYSTGSVIGAGSSYAGGLVGYNYSGWITSCYSTGSVTGAVSYVGGLLGRNNFATVIGCFWDIQTSGKTEGVGTGSSTGVTGKFTPEMKMLSAFISADWDFTNTWAICEGTNYPRLQWQIPAGDFVCPDGVDLGDYSFFAQHWQDTNCAANNDCDGADLDVSGSVDWEDMMLFCQHWLE